MMPNPVAPPLDNNAGGTFRPIHYLGSKARVLDLIRNEVNCLDPACGHALDLFSGSGVVATMMGGERPVTSVDIQEYSRVLASALLRPARLPTSTVGELLAEADERAAEAVNMRELVALEEEAKRALGQGDPEPLCEIIECGSIVAHEHDEGPPRGALDTALKLASSRAQSEDLTVTRHYGGVFFSYEQALLLDCLATSVRTLPKAQRDTGLASVLGAASECVTSVGSHFAQPIRPRDQQGQPKPGALSGAVRRRERNVLKIFADLLERYAGLPGAMFEARAVRSDFRAFLSSASGPISVVYADPPYTRDHYSRFYHVLETIAVGDDPAISTVTSGDSTSLSRGLYRIDRHQSPFCIRSQAPGAFEELFDGVVRLGAPLVLSYSPYSTGTAARPRPRVLTIEDLTELALSRFGQVDVRSAGALSHSRFNSERLNGHVETEAESVLICVP